MTAFDTAWDLAKADTGMWDEIYAPLYDVFGGRGRNPNRNAIPLDFIQTKDLPLERHYGGKNAAALQDWAEEDVEKIMQDILEHGMMGRDSHWWHRGRKDLEEARADFDRNKAGETNPGNVAIPLIGFTEDGWQINEGNHRVAALRRLNAPYVPTYTEATWMGKPKPYSVDLPMGSEMRRWLGLSPSPKDPLLGDIIDYGGSFKENRMRDYNIHSDKSKKIDPYGLTARLRDGKYRIPTSFLFGRELVPDRGRLVPDLPEGLNAADMPLNEVRGKDGWWKDEYAELINDPKQIFRNWQNSPKWKIQED